MITFLTEQIWIGYPGLLIIGIIVGRILKNIIRKNMDEENRNFPTKPMVEILNALLYVAVYWKYGLSAETVFFCVLVSVMVLIAFIDFKTMLIPNWCVLVILVAGIIFGFFNGDVSWLERLIGFFVAGGILLLLALLSRGGLGGGDIKLMAAAGVYLGWKLVLWALLCASITGGIVGVIILASGKAGLKTAIPFGPMLVFGILITVIFGKEMIGLYFSLLL